MSSLRTNRMFTLARREMQESRNSLLWTPIGIAAALMVVMLLSVLLADRLSFFGGSLLHVILEDEAASGTNIVINIDSDGENDSATYTIEKNETPADPQDWDFSQEWNFEPGNGEEMQDKLQEELDERVGNLNPLLNMVHNLMLLVLFIVSVTYLLASLYNDRKDRSILFWRSMPVSEWEEVLSKLGVALVVAPAIFIVASLLIQVSYTLIAMLLAWRMNMDPFELILGNIEFGTLIFNQLAGWVYTAAWIAPLYAWLLLASAAAKRSPFFLAVAPIFALGVAEKVFLGSEHFGNALDDHIPHFSDEGSSLGFYLYGPDWAAVDYTSLLLGLVFTAVAITGAVYLRRYRFEL
jgi:ABC-2 type transport system permease protein